MNLKIKFFLLLLLFSQFLLAQTADDYVREWGTYFPDPRDSALDENNNLWVVGGIHSNNYTVFSSLISANAHQENYNGEKEIYLAKISSDGSLMYATYFGGAKNDIPYGIEVKNNYVYIVGSTKSTSNIATANGYDTVLDQNYAPDGTEWQKTAGFLAKFDTQGALVWSTYIQGDIFTEAIYSVAINDNDDIHLWGSTKSTNLATENSFRQTIPGPYLEETTNTYKSDSFPFMMKMNSSGQTEWSTYYGPDDATVFPEGGIVVDNLDNVYVCGRTDDTVNYYGTTGVHQTQSGGGSDTFFSKFSATGNRIWSTYYGGNGSEVAPFIHIGRNGSFYITGLTTSANNIATNGVFQENLINPLANYLAMFNNNGQRLWGSYFNIGSNGGGFATPCFVDAEGEILLSGRTSSTTNTATEGSWQENFGGGTTDAYVVKFNYDGSDVLWGTYFGGTGLEFPFHGGMQLTTNDQFYICGMTTSYNAEAIVTENAIETNGSIGAGLYSGYLAKFVQSSDLSSLDLNSAQIKIWPNPVSSVLIVEGLEGYNSFSIQIYDFQGKLILEKINSNIVNVESLATGEYFLTINSKTMQRNLPFIVR